MGISSEYRYRQSVPDPRTLVITISQSGETADTLAALQHARSLRARGGDLHVLADQDARITPEDGLHVIRMPDHAGMLSPILHTIPLQLLAYHTALGRGTDVDKPRNLAKSVTVE